MTIIRSAGLSSARGPSRKHPTGFSSLTPFSPARLQTNRQMSTSEQKKHHFMVYVPDRTEPGTLQLRMTHRPQHLERINGLRSSGILSACSRAVLLWPRDADVLRSPCQRSLGLLSHTNLFFLGQNRSSTVPCSSRKRLQSRRSRRSSRPTSFTLRT